jgi:hypothetical protein
LNRSNSPGVAKPWISSHAAFDMTSESIHSNHPRGDPPVGGTPGVGLPALMDWAVLRGYESHRPSQGVGGVASAVSGAASETSPDGGGASG